jgi:SagB-type dehydrogenase family enzyme
MRLPRLRYRRSPCLVSYWRGGQLVVHNYAAATRVGVTAAIVELLAALDRWRTVASLTQDFPKHRAANLSRTLERLHDLSIVQRSDRGPSSAERALDAWRDWSPEAPFFHFSTKNPPYGDVDTIDERQRTKAAATPPPPPLKRYRKSPRVSLPASDRGGELARALLARRTWRSFAADPVDVTTLSTLLDLTWGVQHWADFEIFGRIPFRTSPSPGARQNLEAYVLALRIRGLKPGLYHYDADAHALEWLKDRRSLGKVSTYVPRQTWYDDAAVVVFMTAVFGRAQWRYNFPRAYRSILIEAGHFCQTFCLLATSLRLAPFCTAAFAESKLERDLGIDGVNESVIYACGVGTRPPGVRWAPWPHTTDTPRLIPPASAKNRRPR